MTPTSNSISRKTGDSYPIAAVIKDENGDPHDLTGATQIKLGVASKKVLVTGDTPISVVTGTLGDAVAGEVNFTPDQPLLDLGVGDYYAEIQFVQNTFIYTTNTFAYNVMGQIILS